MNSRERILAAIRREPVDRVPLYLRLWDMHDGTDNFPFRWRDQLIRAESLLKLGVDDTLLLEPPLGYTEEYHAEQAEGVSAFVTGAAPVREGRQTSVTEDLSDARRATPHYGQEERGLDPRERYHAVQ